MMRIAEGAIVALLALTLCPIAASAQEEKCPKGLSNDDCDEWYFERADKVLTEATAKKIAEGSKLVRTRSDLVEAIRQSGQEAHRAWVAFREAECKAYVAANVMSARTEMGKKMSCLLELTERRIEEVKER